MSLKPAPKINQIFEKIDLFFSNGVVPDDLSMMRLKQDANSIIENIDASQGYVLLGALATIHMDYETSKKHFDHALKLNKNDISHYLNYIVSLNYMNRSSESYDLICSEFDRFKNNPEFLKLVMRTVISSGNLSKSDELMKNFYKLLPKDKSVEMQAVSDINNYFKKCEIQDELAKKLIQIADKVLLKNKIGNQTNEVIYDEENLYFWVKVRATIDKVVEMNIDLCDELASCEELIDKNTFSIAFQAI